MPVSPDDLLIFKLREGRVQKAAAEPVKKQAAKVQPKAQQAPQQQQQVPAAASAAAPAQTQRAPQQAVSPQRVLQEGKIAAAREVMNRTFVAPSGSYAQVEEALATEGMNVADYASGKRETKAQTESKEAAVGLSCVWHPWRTAYAICDYCHRPFCFEDIMEHNGHYYCLEDIDAVSAAGPAKEAQGLSYGKMSFASGALLVLSFAVFLLFANGQLAYIVGYANSVGFFMFLSSMTAAEALTFTGMLVSFFEFVAGILIFMQSKKGFAASLGMSLLGALLFSYQFLTEGTLYSLVVGAASFAAMIAVAASTRTMRFTEKEEAPAAQVAPAEFSNVGRF